MKAFTCRQPGGPGSTLTDAAAVQIAERRRREAEALRQNLARRKQQARSRADNADVQAEKPPAQRAN